MDLMRVLRRRMPQPPVEKDPLEESFIDEDEDLKGVGSIGSDEDSPLLDDGVGLLDDPGDEEEDLAPVTQPPKNEDRLKFLKNYLIHRTVRRRE